MSFPYKRDVPPSHPKRNNYREFMNTDLSAVIDHARCAHHDQLRREIIYYLTFVIYNLNLLHQRQFFCHDKIPRGQFIKINSACKITAVEFS